MPATAATLTASPRQRGSVLVAEDNVVNQEVAKYYLEDLGYPFAVAADGVEAVAMFEAQPFDIVLMDCQMPNMDGFQALHAIRRYEAGTGRPAAKIIAVTAAEDTETRAACAVAGFDGFLNKPFTTDQLQMAMAADCASTPSDPAPAATEPVRTADTATAIDRPTFKAFVDDFGAETAAGLLASFVKLIRDSLTRFDAASATGDAAGLQALAHKLAGAAGTVGALRLAERARQIDTTAKRGRTIWPQDLAEFRADIAQTNLDYAPLLDTATLQAFLDNRHGSIA